MSAVPVYVTELAAKFHAGSSYVLFCSLKHHRSRGMVAHISVLH